MWARLFTVLREGKCAQDRGYIIIKVCFFLKKKQIKMRKKRNESIIISRKWMVCYLVLAATTQEKTRKVNKILIASWTKLKSEQIIFPLALTAGYADKSPRPKIRAVGLSRSQYLSVYWLLKSKGRLSG